MIIYSGLIMLDHDQNLLHQAFAQNLLNVMLLVVEPQLKVVIVPREKLVFGLGLLIPFNLLATKRIIPLSLYKRFRNYLILNTLICYSIHYRRGTKSDYSPSSSNTTSSGTRTTSGFGETTRYY